MTSLFWILGGLLGGAVGAVIWIVVGLATQYEVGYIAWGVGFTTGVGLRYFAYLKDVEESDIQGMVAGLIAALAIIGAKYVVYRSILPADSVNILVVEDDGVTRPLTAKEREAFDVGSTSGDVTIRPIAFKDVFGIWDALWFGLAVITAYKIGEGSFGGDD